MRPFNIEEAKEGKPVCTRKGRPVNILCYNRKDTNRFIIVALVDYENEELLRTYTIEGKSSCYLHEDDLMMASEKHEGWINVYHGSGIPYPGDHIYDSKEKAFEMRDIYDSYVDSIKIEWEE